MYLTPISFSTLPHHVVSPPADAHHGPRLLRRRLRGQAASRPPGDRPGLQQPRVLRVLPVERRAGLGVGRAERQLVRAGGAHLGGGVER